MSVHPRKRSDVDGKGIEERDGLLCILCEPNGGEVAPAELSDDNIATVREGVANLDGMIASFDVVLPVLLVFCHDGSRW